MRIRKAQRSGEQAAKSGRTSGNQAPATNQAAGCSVFVSQPVFEPSSISVSPIKTSGISAVADKFVAHS